MASTPDAGPQQPGHHHPAHAAGQSPALPADPAVPQPDPGPQDPGAPAPASPEPADTSRTRSAWSRIAHTFTRPRLGGGHLIVGVLCAALGFALVLQVRQTQEDAYSNLREDELVRLLDSVSQHTEQLQSRKAQLTQQRNDLQSSTDKAAAAQQAAQQRAETQGLLAGTLPAQGPGVILTITDPQNKVKALQLLGIMEELRNSGAAEVIAVNDVRLTMSSWFDDGTTGVIVDGQVISPPYRWSVIGDASSLDTALNIHGGAMAQIRAVGADGTVVKNSDIHIDAVVTVTDPTYATPVPAESPTPH